jgi:hypothetical protein
MIIFLIGFVIMNESYPTIRKIVPGKILMEGCLNDTPPAGFSSAGGGQVFKFSYGVGWHGRRSIQSVPV